MDEYEKLEEDLQKLYETYVLKLVLSPLVSKIFRLHPETKS
jgi:hypothetical protein